MKVALTGCAALYAKELVEVGGDIPGRSIFFGRVDESLPEIREREFDFRTCRLVAWAVEKLRPQLDGFLARYAKERIAVVLGTSNTGIDEAQRHVEGSFGEGGEKRGFGDGFRFSMIELGTPADYLGITLGVAGPCYSISTACSSSAKVFPAARRLIEAGICDAAIVGGADGRCRFAMNGFHALGALSQGKCRPLADDRDGICLGEGVALFLMEREAAATGGSHVFFAGAGETSDACHATAPDPEGRGAEAAMRAALLDARLEPRDIDYVNLHGTGTQANDDMEMKAVRRVFGDADVLVESTKSQTGHCLGAAGAVEAAICWGKIGRGEARRTISNSFAFGGSNASVVLELDGV